MPAHSGDMKLSVNHPKLIDLVSADADYKPAKFGVDGCKICLGNEMIHLNIPASRNLSLRRT